MLARVLALFKGLACCKSAAPGAVQALLRRGGHATQPCRAYVWQLLGYGWEGGCEVTHFARSWGGSPHRSQGGHLHTLTSTIHPLGAVVQCNGAELLHNVLGVHHDWGCRCHHRNPNKVTQAGFVMSPKILVTEH